MRTKTKLSVLLLFTVSLTFFAACSGEELPKTVTTPTYAAHRPTIIIVPAGNGTPTSTPIPEPTEAITEVPTEPPTVLPTMEPTKAPTSKPTKVPTPTPTKVPTKKPTPTPTKAPIELGSYVKGKQTGNTFESEWLNLKFVAPDGVELFSGKEMDSIVDSGMTMIFDLAQVAVDFEMAAVSDKGASAMVMVLHGKEISDELWNEVSGWEDETIGEVSLFGETYLSAVTSEKADVGTVYEEIYMRKKENHLVFLVFTYMDNSVEDIADMARGFSSYK